MASIRTARVLAAVAAVPLALGVLGGVAHADGFADDGSSASVSTSLSDGVSGDNNGISNANQQVAAGSGASNEANNANVQGYGPIAIDQSTNEYTVIFDW
jgi:hypothetical protein